MLDEIIEKLKKQDLEKERHEDIEVFTLHYSDIEKYMKEAYSKGFEDGRKFGGEDA